MNLQELLSKLKTSGVSEDALLIAIKHALNNYELLDTMEKVLEIDHATAIQLAVASKITEFSNFPIEPYWLNPDLPALDFGFWVAANADKLDHEIYGQALRSSLRLLYQQAPMLLPQQQKPKRLLPSKKAN